MHDKQTNVEMPVVDEKLISHVAALARLSLTNEEILQFSKELKEVIEMFQVISEADVNGFEPSIQPVSDNELMREDAVDKTSMLSRDDALSLSPNSKDGYFKGPKAL